MDKKLTTRQEYDETKAIVETLITEATERVCLNLKWITSTLVKSLL